MSRFSNKDIEALSEGIPDTPLDSGADELVQQSDGQNLPYELYRGQGGWVIIYRNFKDGSTATVASGLNEKQANSIIFYLNGYHR